jgi:hypothetical protein
MQRYRQPGFARLLVSRYWMDTRILVQHWGEFKTEIASVRRFRKIAVLWLTRGNGKLVLTLLKMGIVRHVIFIR